MFERLASIKKIQIYQLVMPSAGVGLELVIFLLHEE